MPLLFRCKINLVIRTAFDFSHYSVQTSPFFVFFFFSFQDEDIYTFFEPELPSEALNSARTKTAEAVKAPAERRHGGKQTNSKNSSKTSHSKNQKPLLSSERKASSTNHNNSSNAWQSSQENMSWHEGSSVLDLKGDNYFSCAVGRKRSNARYLLNSSEDVVLFLRGLAMSSSKNRHFSSNQHNGDLRL